jgi:hypothetical protein
MGFKAHLWHPTSVKKERWLLGGQMHMVVVLELHQWKEVVPVILLLVNKEVEILVKLLVDTFRLSICLRMPCSTQCKLDPKESVELLCESCDKLWTMV